MCTLFWTDFVCSSHGGVYKQEFVEIPCSKALEGSGLMGSCGEVKGEEGILRNATCGACNTEKKTSLGEGK